MADFMMIRKGTHQAWESFSADEKQRLMEKYFSFVNYLKREDRFKGGSGLKSGGVQLRSDGGLVITDGPFSVTKEALNGYLVFSAVDKDEALAIARTCPALTHGETIEVFELTGS